MFVLLILGVLTLLPGTEHGASSFVNAAAHTSTPEQWRNIGASIALVEISSVRERTPVDELVDRGRVTLQLRDSLFGEIPKQMDCAYAIRRATIRSDWHDIWPAFSPLKIGDHLVVVAIPNAYNPAAEVCPSDNGHDSDTTLVPTDDGSKFGAIPPAKPLQEPSTQPADKHWAVCRVVRVKDDPAGAAGLRRLAKLLQVPGKNQERKELDNAANDPDLLVRRYVSARLEQPKQ